MNEPIYSAHHLIRNARIGAGLTQRGVADQLGITNTAVSNFETGYLPITSTSTLDQLATVLGIDRIDLYAAANMVPPELLDQLRAMDGDQLRKVIRRAATVAGVKR